VEFVGIFGISWELKEFRELQLIAGNSQSRIFQENPETLTHLVHNSVEPTVAAQIHRVADRSCSFQNFKSNDKGKKFHV
jgi:hypothetical protein